MKTRNILFSLAVLSSLAYGGDVVYDVQSQLSDRGYNVSVDGVLGRGTAKAIRQYQEDNGLRVNGRVTNELIESLGGGQSSKVTSTTSYQQSSNSGGFLDGIQSGNLTKNFKDGKYKVGF